MWVSSEEAKHFLLLLFSRLFLQLMFRYLKIFGFGRFRQQAQLRSTRFNEFLLYGVNVEQVLLNNYLCVLNLLRTKDYSGLCTEDKIAVEKHAATLFLREKIRCNQASVIMSTILHKKG